MSYLYCGGTESLKTSVPDLLEVRVKHILAIIILTANVQFNIKNTNTVLQHLLFAPLATFL